VFQRTGRFVQRRHWFDVEQRDPSLRAAMAMRVVVAVDRACRLDHQQDRAGESHSRTAVVEALAGPGVVGFSASPNRSGLAAPVG